MFLCVHKFKTHLHNYRGKWLCFTQWHFILFLEKWLHWFSSSPAKKGSSGSSTPFLVLPVWDLDQIIIQWYLIVVSTHSFIYFSTENWTQGLVHARQVLHHWVLSPVISLPSFPPSLPLPWHSFLDSGSHRVQALIKLDIFNDDLEVLLFLPLSSECGDCRLVPSCLCIWY